MFHFFNNGCIDLAEFFWLIPHPDAYITVRFHPVKFFDKVLQFRPRQQPQWKRRSERRKHCALPTVRWSQKCSSRHRSPSGGRDGQNLISRRWSLPLLTNPVWWGSMPAISSYHGNRPADKQTNPQTGLITIHCTTASLACSVIKCVRCTRLKKTEVSIVTVDYLDITSGCRTISGAVSVQNLYQQRPHQDPSLFWSSRWPC